MDEMLISPFLGSEKNYVWCIEFTDISRPHIKTSYGPCTCSDIDEFIATNRNYPGPAVFAKPLTQPSNTYNQYKFSFIFSKMKI
jgi:hypothetical protein